MAVVIKYQVAFPDTGLTVSNDAFSGDFIIDASIKVPMLRGARGTTFDITLLDLPEKKVKELAGVELGKVVVKLGYFDGPFEPVLEGLYKEIKSSVEGEKLVTSLAGMEVCTHALTRTLMSYTQGSPTPLAQVVRDVLQQAKITEGAIDKNPDVAKLKGSFPTVRFVQERLIDILSRVAQRADGDFLVCDKHIRMGAPIETPRAIPLRLSSDDNLARFKPFSTQLPEERENLLKALPATKATGFSFLIAGDPGLRPGQKILTDIDGYEGAAGDEFRVDSVVHRWSVSEGYVCEGVAKKVCLDANSGRVAGTGKVPTPDEIAASLTLIVQRQTRRGGSTEVAKVQAYQPGSASDPLKHRATLYTGQHFDPTETQPSVRGEVDNDQAQLAHGAPMVSPFAWRKCGLVVPVYPGMRALLSHNLNLPEDVLVSGFLWSEDPALEPPQSKEGDWWLCLPIDFQASSPPSDSTKAVNDLVTNTGKRVIDAKGLKITIGTSKLGNVGERPAEGADDELLIEHKSGTKLTIEAGGDVKLEAKKVSIKGDLTIEGDVEIK